MKTRYPTTLLLIGSLLCLGACTMVGPDYQRPEAEVQAQWLEADDARIKSGETDFRNWWQILGDPVLDKLIGIAYEQNLSIQQAAVRILQSRAIRAVAVGEQYPQLQELSGGYTRNQLSRNAPNQSLADHAFGNYSLNFDVSWELDFWGKFGRGIEAATAELAADIATYDDLIVSVVAEVALAYVELRTVERRLELARQNVRIQERGLQLADVRFRGGAVTELDVSQARALMNDTKARIPVFEIQARQVKNGLCVLLGQPPSDLSAELGAPAPIPSSPPEVVIGMPSDLLRRRPDIRRAERLAAAQCARIGVAESELYPAFSLLGSLGLQTGDSGSMGTSGDDITDLFEARSFTGLLGLGFRWPVFNYGRLKNNVRAQDAAFQELILNYKNVVLLAAAEVENSMVGFLRTQERVALLLESEKAAQRSVELSDIQYRDGAVDYQRVLDAQSFLSDEQDALARSQGDVILNLVAMYKALGGGWEVRRVKNFVPESIQDEMRQRTDWDGWLPADVPGGPPEEGGPDPAATQAATEPQPAPEEKPGGQ